MQFSPELQDRILAYIAKFGAGLGILAAAVILYVVVRHMFALAERRKHLPGQLVGTLRRVTACAIAIASIVLLLQTYGVLQSVFAALAGMFALVAIGFVAVWSVLSNTLCSLIMLIVRPFRVGDHLRFPPDEWGGRVVNFNMLFTVLETDDGFTLQVPNNTFFQRPILRRSGVQRINLGDQLYRREDAHFPEPKQAEHQSTEAAPSYVTK